jgi:uncharacterized protein YoaH (UPF0181 family)
MNDPIVDEVRRYRDEHAKKFNYDLSAICADFRNKHNQYVERLKKLEATGIEEGQANLAVCEEIGAYKSE